MRVVSGIYRGKKLKSPIDELTRPTSDKVKESLFNIIGNKVVGATCLDLFAGSGALGIECLSRGASKVIFNDKNHNAIKVIKDNLASLSRIEGEIEVLQLDYKEALKGLNCKIDILLLDPPYALGVHQEVIDYLMNNNKLNEEAVLVVETSKNSDLKALDIYDSFKEYKYGLTKLTVIRLK